MKRYQRRMDTRAGTGQQEAPEEVPKEGQETRAGEMLQKKQEQEEPNPGQSRGKVRRNA